MSVKLKKIGNDATNRIMVMLNTDVLDRIEKELGKKFVAQVGVLGSKASGRLAVDRMRIGGKSGSSKVSVVTGDSSLTNAEIGLIHEKGSFLRGIPQRSFLAMPLTTRMPKVMSKVGEILLKGLTVNNIQQAYAKLGIIAEGIVLKAFSSQGFGMWSDNKAATIARKGSSRPLIDTAQLRQSISSRVVSK